MAARKIETPFQKYFWPALAIGTVGVLVLQGNKVVKATVEPAIKEKAKKQRAAIIKTETKALASDTFLVKDKKKIVKGKVVPVPPYYYNLNTVAAKIYKNLHGSIFSTNTQNTVTLIRLSQPYMMLRLAELYDLKYSRSLIDDLVKYLSQTQQDQIRTWLNKL